MRTNIASNRSVRTRTTPSQSQPWQWPCALRSGEVTPDTRLLCPEIPDLKARLCFPNEVVVTADVSSVSHHDVVLKVQDLQDTPVMGQVVEVSIADSTKMVLDSQKSILHWSGVVNKRSIIALFTINSVESALDPSLQDDARGEIRFPVEVAATIRAADGREIFGRILDYSLGGCRLISDEPLALDCEYRTTVQMPNASVDVALRPCWALKGERGYQMGCTFRSEEGVLMACRHHTQPDGLTRPMRPQLNNWDRPAE